MEAAPPVLTLLGKPGCHLCHVMRGVVERVLPAFRAVLIERDVRRDPELEHRYGLAVPVLLFEGREVARHRISEADLRGRLAGLGVQARPRS